MRLPVTTKNAIEHFGGQVVHRVQQIREIESMKSDLVSRINGLCWALDASGALAEEDLVRVAGGFEACWDSGPRSIEAVAEQQRVERVWGRVRQMALDMESGAFRAVCRRMRAAGVFRKVEVEARLDDLHKRLSALKGACDALVSSLGQSALCPSKAAIPA